MLHHVELGVQVRDGLGLGGAQNTEAGLEEVKGVDGGVRLEARAPGGRLGFTAPVGRLGFRLHP